MLHTALIDLLTPLEIQAVIAHELGHLKCEHGVYVTLANLMVLAAGQMPYWGVLLAQNLQQQLMTWLRCAEFTCDRAGLLVSQDPTVMMSVLMKLTGGSPQLAPQLNVSAFLAQGSCLRRGRGRLQHPLENATNSSADPSASGDSGAGDRSVGSQQ